jgi:hypothetical protein
MYLQAGCLSCLGCRCLWLGYLSRSSLELYKFLCNGQNYPDHCVIDIKCLHHPLDICTRKNICTHEQGGGLGWVVTASGLCSDFTEQEIVDFQELADDFYGLWIKLKHLDGLDNSFHLVGAGHLASNQQNR